MTPPRTIVCLLVVVCILSASGCTDISGSDNRSADSSGNSGPDLVAKYKLTLAQPEASAQMIRMDSDVYNLGEVVEFVIFNEKTGDLSCKNDPPAFSIRYQKGNGGWVTRMGEENPAAGTTMILKPGESTAPYRFVTSGWVPGRYRIVTDCGVSREILLRALPTAAPEAAACPPTNETAPYIRVNPVSNQQAGEPFDITGTTNLAAGEDLRYSLFVILTGTGNVSTAKLVSSTTTISAGACGINTWYVDGVIDFPGEYFIGISDNANTVSAIKRFTVLEERPAETATLPETTPAPGIATG